MSADLLVVEHPELCGTCISGVCVHIPYMSQVDHTKMLRMVSCCTDAILVHKVFSHASGTKTKASADDGAGDADSIGQTDPADTRAKR